MASGKPPRGPRAFEPPKIPGTVQRRAGPPPPPVPAPPVVRTVPPPAAVAQAARKKGTPMSLGAFNATYKAPPPKAWGQGGTATGVAVATAVGGGGMAPPAPAIVGPPTRFNGGCTAKNWDNSAIQTLLGAGQPAKFYISNKKDLGTALDDATRYWSFNAMWVKTGSYVNGGAGVCQLNDGTYVDGELRLHFHPHAKPTSNYLHIKKSDGSDPGAGAFQNGHWLVGALGFTKADLTPDGK